MVMGTDIRDASPVIMKHLRESMLPALCCTIDEKLRYREAHIWVLYIGALYERGVELADTGLPTRTTSFQELLVREAREMGIMTWKQMQVIERKFMQTDLLRPQGYTWFESVVAKS